MGKVWPYQTSRADLEAPRRLHRQLQKHRPPVSMLQWLQVCLICRHSKNITQQRAGWWHIWCQSQILPEQYVRMPTGSSSKQGASSDSSQLHRIPAVHTLRAIQPQN